MDKQKKKVEVVKRYHFRRDGVEDTQGYDWIGKKCAAGLYPVELNGKLGFADRNGEIVVPIIYDTLGTCNDTISSCDDTYLNLRKNKLEGLVKNDGTVVVEFKWPDMQLWKLSEDLIPVAIGKKWGFANVKTGKTQVEPAYDEVEFFINGFAPVRIEDKWGIIDKDGNMIIEPKYLIKFWFECDFANVFEGGSVQYCGRSYGISDSNCKIVNKKGYEIITDCSWIDRVGFNMFSITTEKDGKQITTIKQFIPLSDYIVVIDGGEYVGGYYKTKYLGGEWSAIDYTGKPIEIPESELQKVKHKLLSVK